MKINTVMSINLPINIENILHGKTVEWQRLEFKKDWNPESVLHTMCAFANDIHNQGGGYIFIGIEEVEGKPVLPPIGLGDSQMDYIQKKLLNLGYNYTIPQYHPVIVPYVINGKNVLVIWVPGGQDRPYKAREKLGTEDSQFRYYIRRGSSTVRATSFDEKALMSVSEGIPFDDRVNYKATIEDLEYGLIKEFLYDINSGLKNDLNHLEFEQLCRQMTIIDGPSESIKPRNVGLMFFNERPYEFFPYTQIDVIHFPEGPGGDRFFEKIFKGPVWKILKAALQYIENSVIVEHIFKYPDRAEADRIYNVPYIAIEEALVNAMYHRSYDIREPVEVRILPEEICIKSFPGPDISIDLNDLQQGRGTAKQYRNRRIGDLLKELDLTEGRGTGIPKIIRAMRANESPAPSFESDEGRNYFLTVLPVHPKVIELERELKKEKAEEGALEEGEGLKIKSVAELMAKSGAKLRAKSKELFILNTLLKGATSRDELASLLGDSQASGAIKRLLKKLLDSGLIQYTSPEHPRSRSQKYKISKSGQKYLSKFQDQ